MEMSKRNKILLIFGLSILFFLFLAVVDISAGLTVLLILAYFLIPIGIGYLIYRKSKKPVIRVISVIIMLSPILLILGCGLYLLIVLSPTNQTGQPNSLIPPFAQFLLNMLGFSGTGLAN